MFAFNNLPDGIELCAEHVGFKLANTIALCMTKLVSSYEVPAARGQSQLVDRLPSSLGNTSPLGGLHT